MTSNWYSHLVNVNASPEERRLKYHLCRCLGDSSRLARRIRNWRWNKIARFHGYNDFNQLALMLGKGGERIEVKRYNPVDLTQVENCLRR